MSKIDERIRTLDRYSFETPPRWEIGDKVVDKHGNLGTVAGVGLIDFAPEGPAYEIVELRMQPGKTALAWGVDLEEDDGS